MKTFKVTFFEMNLDVNSIETYHNMGSDYDVALLVASNICAKGLLPLVKCFVNGEECTEAFNCLLKYRIKDITKNMRSLTEPNFQYTNN